MLFLCGFLNIDYKSEKLDRKILRGSSVRTYKVLGGKVQDILWKNVEALHFQVKVSLLTYMITLNANLFIVKQR